MGRFLLQDISQMEPKVIIYNIELKYPLGLWSTAGLLISDAEVVFRACKLYNLLITIDSNIEDIFQDCIFYECCITGQKKSFKDCVFQRCSTEGLI